MVLDCSEFLIEIILMYHKSYDIQLIADMFQKWTFSCHTCNGHFIFCRWLISLSYLQSRDRLIGVTRKVTHCGLVTPYDDIQLGQHIWRFEAWRHQPITWTNVDFSLVRCCGIHLRVISPQVPMLLFCIMSLKIILWLVPHPAGANDHRSAIGMPSPSKSLAAKALADS